MRESNIPQSVIEITDALQKNVFVFTDVKFLFGKDNVAVVIAELTEGDQISVFEVFEKECFSRFFGKVW